MRYIFNIYNTVIDNKYIRIYPVSKESFQFNGRDIIAATMKISLDNTDRSVFSPFEPGSLFFGADWNKQPVTIYDTEDDNFIWKGRITNIQESWNNNTVVISTTNWVRDMADLVCVYSDTSGTVTPAEHILNILTDPDLLDLDDDDLNLNGFNNAINIQDAAGVYCSVAYTQEKNKKCLTVIKELLRITQCHLFTDKNNKVKLYQWQKWNGVSGTIINNRDMKTKSFVAWYDVKNIINDISIYYDLAGTATKYADSDTTSIDQYGKMTFAVPDSEPDTTSSNNNIMLSSLVAATWCGDLALERYDDMKQKFKLTLFDRFRYFGLGDQTDLSFGPFTTEPAQIEKINYDPNKGDVKIEGEFLNIPNQYIVRDEEPPVKVELITALAGDQSVLLKWTQSFESDHIGYRIYYTASPGEWNGEFSNLGRSPVTVKTPSIDGDGYAYETIHELNNGTEYYFKITSYDSSFNESADSNVDSATPIAVADNRYMLTGDPYTGLTLDNTNSKNGTPISGLSVYDTAVYDTGLYTYTAHYDSYIYHDPDGFSSILWKASGDANDIRYQVRYSDDGAIWESWSTESDAIGSKAIALDDSYPYFQIRFIFYSTLWSDTDTIFIREITNG